ncbi:MAG TPA: right-handed parallel beta-helix repeat-containing protein [Geobacteraceae bacterium]
MNSLSRISLFLVVLTFSSLLLPGVSHAVTLIKDTVWQGEVRVTEDVLVPRGVSLTIRPGTRIMVAAAESTKTDPEYLSPLTEITVRGTLRVEGSAASPVEFSGVEKKAGSWAGIMVDKGIAILSGCRVRNAETGVYVFDGNLRMAGSMLLDGRYGLVAQGQKADVAVEDSRIAENDYGVFALQGAHLVTGTSVVQGNRKRDTRSSPQKAFREGTRPDTRANPPVSRRYRDEVFRGDAIWQGRVEVDGTIRVPEGSRLIIMPGTIVEFLKRDTSGSGIGENGLLVQGRLIAKGTREQPIIFRSAEKDKKMGDWDAINIMNSSGGQNLLEYCRIEDAYRGLHFHFSNVSVRHSVITNSYRAVQFQESLVELQGNTFSGNKSGIQGRDSDIALVDNVISGNYLGANFLRANLTARGNSIAANWKEGLRIREGASTLQENLIDGNRQGLLLADMYYGEFSRNSITNNLEVGISVKNADNIGITGNFIAGNGVTGLGVQEASAVVRENLISDNGERGIGVLSFDGIITENNIVKNGRYAIDLDGTKDVSAPSNWWGGDEPARVILDKRVVAARGRVKDDAPSPKPFHFEWPVQTLSTDATWRGDLTVGRTVTVLPGTALSVAPGTVVEFAPGSGLAVKGKLLARGRSDGKIVFTSLLKKGASDWDEIQLEYATGSVISHCVFEYATWGLHSHFTDLSVSDSLFANNFGGMRFRSGPVEIRRSTFRGNSIGIRAYLGNAAIRENTITQNETGIFVREKGGGLLITRNNIFDNSNYNVRVGDFNNEDVNARENWWGNVDPLQTIFDGRSEPGIGNVLFEPYLNAPVKADVSVTP